MGVLDIDFCACPHVKLPGVVNDAAYVPELTGDVTIEFVPAVPVHALKSLFSKPSLKR